MVISIIIPVLNEASTIEQFLNSLRERAGDAEIIVVDGDSRDGTFDLARPHCDQCLRSSRGRALQMNAGRLMSQRLHILDIRSRINPRIPIRPAFPAQFRRRGVRRA